MARVDFSLDLSTDLIAVFLTLFVLELVLGIDNVIFISILASKLPREQQARARNLGLTLAMILRIGLVFLAGWIITLKEDVVELAGVGFSIKDFILILGGTFLVYKAVHEIHQKLAVQLRPTYPSVDESVAVAAAISRDPGAGSLGLSSRPVEGTATEADERTGLG